mgnify:CR=1 FL=1
MGSSTLLQGNAFVRGDHVQCFFKQGPRCGGHDVQLFVQFGVFGAEVQAVVAVVFEPTQLANEFCHMPGAFTQHLAGNVGHALQNFV